MVKRILFVALALVISSIVDPKTLPAQCGYFGQCTAGDHRLPEGDPANENPHSDCGACILGPCHPVCGGGELASDPALRDGYLAIVSAATQGDVPAVIRLASGAPGFVFDNAERGSIQLKACSGPTVIANLKILAPALVALAQRLPSSTQLYVDALMHRTTRQLVEGSIL